MLLQTASKLLVFCAVIIMVYTQFTDADLFDDELIPGHSLTATTLDFSSLDTASLTPKSLFFSIVGLQPTGFQVESLRIKNEGQLLYTYALTTQQTAGADPLCQALQVTVLKNWTPLYTGSLLGLALNAEVTEAEPYQDLVFMIALQDSSPVLANTSCSFTFTLSSIQQADLHFSDTEILANTVATSSWTQ